MTDRMWVTSFIGGPSTLNNRAESRRSGPVRESLVRANCKLIEPQDLCCQEVTEYTACPTTTPALGPTEESVSASTRPRRCASSMPGEEAVAAQILHR